MAGIGFRLKKIVAENTSFANLFKAYLYSSMVATGPLLAIIIGLSISNRLALVTLSIEDTLVFQAIILYVFAFSIIGASPPFYVVIRYLADKMFEKHIRAFTPTYLTTLEGTFVFQGIVAAVFLYFQDFPLSTKFIIFALYLCVSGVWIAMIFLSAARSYMGIVLAFVIGTGIGAVATYFWAESAGLQGFLKGFALGQAIVFLILNYRVFVEFGYDSPNDYGVLLYFKRFPMLILVGIFYYVGIWVDRFVFWTSPIGETVGGGLRFCTLYDVPVFFAFLTIVPAMAFFLIQMETSFVNHYQSYFDAIRQKKPLSEIQNKHKGLLLGAAQNFERYIIFQGIITGLVLVFAPNIGQALYLNPYQYSIFRISVFAAFLQFGYITILNFLFYFDFQKETCLIAVTYLILNGVFSWLSLQIGIQAYGFGYAVASFATLVLAVLVFNLKMKNLNYWLFMKQPISKPKFRFETEKKVPVPAFGDSTSGLF